VCESTLCVRKFCCCNDLQKISQIRAGYGTIGPESKIQFSPLTPKEYGYE